MKNYDFKLKMKTLWMWRYSSTRVCVSCEAPWPENPKYNIFGDRWRPHPGKGLWLYYKEALKLFPKLPKDPRELWQIKPNGEVIVWEWTP